MRNRLLGALVVTAGLWGCTGAQTDEGPAGAKAQKAFEGGSVSVMKVYGMGCSDATEECKGSEMQRLWVVVSVPDGTDGDTVELSLNGGEPQTQSVAGEVTNDEKGNPLPTVTFPLYGASATGQISVGFVGSDSSNIGFVCSGIDGARHDAIRKADADHPVGVANYQCMLQTQQQ
jgi:hypothetical protein